MAFHGWLFMRGNFNKNFLWTAQHFVNRLILKLSVRLNADFMVVKLNCKSVITTLNLFICSYIVLVYFLRRNVSLATTKILKKWRIANFNGIIIKFLFGTIEQFKGKKTPKTFIERNVIRNFKVDSWKEAFTDEPFTTKCSGTWRPNACIFYYLQRNKVSMPTNQPFKSWFVCAVVYRI